MTTSQELHDRIVGQNLGKRFLTNLDANADVEVVRWKDADGGWHGWTMTELADVTARLATGLAGLGVGKGDTVVLMMRNRPEFHALDLAVLFLGATPVSIYNSSAPDQIDYLVNDCKAKLAVVEDDGFLERFLKVRESLATLEHHRADRALGDRRQRRRAVQRPRRVRTRPTCASSPRSPRLDDIATIIYTSGTTGPPKGVMLSHSNIAWTLESVGQSMRDQTDIEDFAGKKHLSYLPMAHIFERLLGHYYMLDFAAQVTCCPETSQLTAYTGEVRPNVFIGVPRVWEKLYAGVNAALAGDPEKSKAFNDAVDAAAADRREDDTRHRHPGGDRHLELPRPGRLPDRARVDRPRRDRDLHHRRRSTAGRDPRLVPRHRRTAHRGLRHVGELRRAHVGQRPQAGLCRPGGHGRRDQVSPTTARCSARGGNVFVGYLGKPEQTADTIDSDGWLHTGDIGELDEDGYLKIVDRKKELIITAGGKNVSPANLEAELKMIPLVGQACAIGEQRPFMSALVVLDPDAAAAWAASHGLSGDDATMAALAENPEVVAEINAGLVEVMAGFNNAEAVKKVKILGEEWLPDSELLTPTSKLKRRGILATFADEIDALYAK